MNREHLESMRWLYDSDESYKKAVRQIMAEEVKEKRRALLKKKLRQARMQKRLRTLTKPLKRIRLSGPKHLKAQALGLFRKVTASRKRMVLCGAAVLAVLVVGVMAYGTYASRHKPVPGNGGSDVAGATTTAPQAPFDPVITSDKASKPEDYRYDEAKQLLTYSATISNTKATISQQPFPEEFLKDSKKFEDFLAGIPNKQTVPLSSGTAYLSVIKGDTDKDPLAAIAGTDGQVQYAVYINPKFLVFVRTQEPITKDKWQDYFKYFTLN